MSVLGPKQWYAYTSDNGKVYQFYGRAADNDAIGNTAVGPSDHPSIPSRLVKRHVWGVASPGNRRKFWIGSTGNSHYSTGGSVAVDSATFIIEGRVGEKDKGVVSD
jgi:hypothetical protein